MDNKPKTSKIKCKKGHDVVCYRNGFKMVAPKDKPATLDKSLTHYCQFCKSNFSLKNDDSEGFTSCKYECDWFGCYSCSTCHYCHEPKEILNKQSPDYSYSNEHWGYCTKCNAYFNYEKEKDPEKQKFFYCHPCRTSWCRKCMVPDCFD